MELYDNGLKAQYMTVHDYQRYSLLLEWGSLYTLSTGATRPMRAAHT